MASKFIIQKAEEKDSDALNELMRDTTQPSRVTMGLEREPNFFYGTKVATSKPLVMISRMEGDNKLACCSSLGARDVYVNGKIQSIRYASDLRIREEYRKGTLLARIFRTGKKELKPGEMLQTHILAENFNSISVLGSGKAGLPRYWEYGDYNMHMVYYSAFNKPPMKSRYTVRRATESDIEKMQDFFNTEAPKKQFYPHYDFDKVGTDDPYYRDLKIGDYYLAFDGENIVGITGVWDQKRFKQTRFVGYHWIISTIRPFFNLFSKIFGGFYLPPVGEILKYFYLHTVLTKDNDVDIFNALLREIYRNHRGGENQAFVCGLVADDPLNQAFEAYKKQTLPGKHFLVCYDGDPRPTLDNSRPLYLEISRL